MSNKGSNQQNPTKTSELSEGNSKSYRTVPTPTQRPDSVPSGQGSSSSSSGGTSGTSSAGNDKK